MSNFYGYPLQLLGYPFHNLVLGEARVGVGAVSYGVVGRGDSGRAAGRRRGRRPSRGGVTMRAGGFLNNLSEINIDLTKATIFSWG